MSISVSYDHSLLCFSRVSLTDCRALDWISTWNASEWSVNANVVEDESKPNRAKLYQIVKAIKFVSVAYQQSKLRKLALRFH